MKERGIIENGDGTHGKFIRDAPLHESWLRFHHNDYVNLGVQGLRVSGFNGELGRKSRVLVVWSEDLIFVQNAPRTIKCPLVDVESLQPIPLL